MVLHYVVVALADQFEMKFFSCAQLMWTVIVGILKQSRACNIHGMMYFFNFQINQLYIISQWLAVINLFLGYFFFLVQYSDSICLFSLSCIVISNVKTKLFFSFFFLKYTMCGFWSLWNQV